MTPSLAANHGQVIEYIPDRLYLASYTHAPTDHTPFPYPAAPKSPSKRSRAHYAPASVSVGPGAQPPAYFTVDDELLYNAFHHDFGPLHIGHLYRFAVKLHDVLGDPANKDRPVVFWSKADPRSRANAACMLACYMVLIQSWPPHLALAPIAQADPPFMPFRDAGYSQADYTLTIQDVVYGVWKAKEEGLCSLQDFSLEEYEKYERVDMGDFNWVTPSFLAFASPQHAPVHPIPTTSPSYANLPTSVASIFASNIPGPFKNVLSHFVQRDIGLVVRLNSELYCPTYFTALGINHLDMIFDDGTCPPLTLVRRFVNLAHQTINHKNKGIAVHCKAGLGRTGCLIGAYLIYRHGFTANEIIAFMRFMRPGMVVGPQQHWLHLNQGAFREWWFEDQFKEKLAAMQPATPTKKLSFNTAGQLATPTYGSHSKRAVLGEMDGNGSTNSSYQEENLPAPTPGQPRKTSRLHERHHPYPRHLSSSYDQDKGPKGAKEPSTEIVGATYHSKPSQGDADEEWELQMLAKRRTSKSPGSDSKRAVSYTQTTTTTTSWTASESDVENQVDRPKSPLGKSGSGTGGLSAIKVRSSPRRAVSGAKGPEGIRKVSGKPGLAGSLSHKRSS